MSNIYRHKKTGKLYKVLTHEMRIQCSTDPVTEAKFKNDEWTAYKRFGGNEIYFRLTNEFLDGRFESIDEPRSWIREE